MLRRAVSLPQRHPRTFAFVLYLCASLLMFGVPIAGDPARRCACLFASTDPGAYDWAFVWWPHALLHGLNPFVSHDIFAPGGVNIAHSALIPGPALVLAPLTAAFGPILSYNVMIVLAPVLAAWFAFLLCRRLSKSVGAALVGGWLFGYSSYLLGQLTAHPNLALVFLAPAMVHLTLRRIDGEISQRRFVALLALVLAGQFLISTEMLFTMSMFGAVALALACLTAGLAARERVLATLPGIGLSYLIAGVVLAPYLYYALQPGGNTVDVARSQLFSNDLLNFAFPTEITRVGRKQFFFLGKVYRAGFVESSAYLGLPLLAIAAAQAITTWRRAGTRILVGVLLVAALLSMGGRLHVAGARTLPLPWAAFDGFPVAGLALPVRFVVAAALAAAVLCALWLADPVRRSAVRWAVALIAVVALLPNVSGHYWQSRQPIPAFFESGNYKRYLRHDEIVLILPLGISDNSMLWQARTRNWFRLAGGYIGEPVAPEYKRDPVFPGLLTGAPIARPEAAYSSFLRRHRVDHVIVDPNLPGPWPPLFARLGMREQRAGGVLLYRVPRRPSSP